MKACLFGATGVVVETARLERLAYNAAFDELGLDLYWNVATYCKLLEIPGGLRRLESVFGDEWLSGLTDDVFALQHEHFSRLASKGLRTRPGIAEAIKFCKSNGVRLAWVTQSTSEMVDTLTAVTEGLSIDDFELVLTNDDADTQQGDGGRYDHALERLGVAASDVVTFEDSAERQAVALAADLQCYMYPGEYALVENDLLVTRDVRETVERVHTLWSARDERAPLAEV